MGVHTISNKFAKQYLPMIRAEAMVGVANGIAKTPANKAAETIPKNTTKAGRWTLRPIMRGIK